MTGAAALLLAGVLATAGIAKARDRGALVATVAQVAPVPVARAAGIGVPAVELVLAAVLAAGLAPRAAGTGAMLLLAGFSAVLVALARRGVADCGCFGTRPGVVPGRSWATGLVRNALLGLAATAVIAAGPAGSPWNGGLAQAALLATVAGGAACAWALAGALRELRAVAPAAPSGGAA